MKWIAAFQRVPEDPIYCSQAFERGRLWSSGYIVAKNGIDIVNAFIVISLPSWRIEYCPWYDDWRWCRAELMYTRFKGWFLYYNFDVEQYT